MLIPFLSSYKQHNLFLCCSTLILTVIAFNYSVKKTWNLYKKTCHAVEKIERGTNIHKEIVEYENELALWRESSLRTYDRKRLLEIVTNFCHNNDLLIKTYPQAKQVNENDFPVVVNEIEIEGSYKNVIRLIYLLEYKERIGSIASLQFSLYKDRKRRKKVLRSNIVMRNIES